jgi:flagellar basal body-associated protein FliL
VSSVRSLLVLGTVFAATVGGIAALDRDGKLPELYTGKPVARATTPPPRWYAIGQPIAVTTSDGAEIRLTVALQLPKRLPAFVRDGEAAVRLEQEPVVRAIVTDTVMQQRPASSVMTAQGRRRLERLLRRRIRAHTDVRVRRVVIPDALAR